MIWVIMSLKTKYEKNANNTKILFLLSLIGGIIYPGSSHSAVMSDTNSVTAETSVQRNARMACWRYEKFGMFIHWGGIFRAGWFLS